MRRHSSIWRRSTAAIVVRASRAGGDDEVAAGIREGSGVRLRAVRTREVVDERLAIRSAAASKREHGSVACRASVERRSEDALNRVDDRSAVGIDAVRCALERIEYRQAFYACRVAELPRSAATDHPARDVFALGRLGA